MLFKQRFWPGLADGSVTLTFRRWARPQVKVRGRYVTPAGVLEVDDVTQIEPGDISEADARRAGFVDRDELVRQLRGPEAGNLYRIALHHAGDDPRVALRDDADLDPAAIEDLKTRLARLDKASTHGPWTRTTSCAGSTRTRRVTPRSCWGCGARAVARRTLPRPRVWCPGTQRWPRPTRTQRPRCDGSPIGTPS